MKLMSDMDMRRSFLAAKSNAKGTVLAMVLALTWAGSAGAQQAFEWETYAKRVTSSQTVEALGSDLFGDSVNLQNGALSFTVTDVDVPGNNALPVRFTRSYTVTNTREDDHNHPLRDWVVQLPRISGRFAPDWLAGDRSTNRCSQMTAPPPGEDRGYTFPLNTFWQGLQLDIPGVGGGELLKITTGADVPKPTNADGTAYLWTTDGQINVSCLSSIGGGGEGFMAVTPDGTKYYFDKMARRSVPGLSETFPDQAGGNPDRRKVAVWEMSLFASKVVDRFGNSVEYTYTNSPTEAVRLTKVVGKDRGGLVDGREINVIYDQVNPTEVERVVSGNRTWSYGYGWTNPRQGQSATRIMNRVTLPDGKFWSIQFSDLSSTTILYDTSGEAGRDCLGGAPTPQNLLNDEPVGTITHPSGAIGTFKVGIREHGRSHVTVNCSNVTLNPINNPNDDSNIFAISYNAWSLLSKQISAPNVPLQGWTYTYSSTIFGVIRTELGASTEYPVCGVLECFKPTCHDESCPGTAETLITLPDGNGENYVFGNVWQYNEGKLLRIERQNSAGSTLESVTDTFDLANKRQAYPADAVYPARYGESLRALSDGFDSEYHRPKLATVTERDGVAFTWSVDIAPTGLHRMDVFARPLSTTESGVAGDGGPLSMQKTVEYHDSFSNNQWVLGQLDNTSINNQEVARADYHPDSQLMHHLYVYGNLSEPKQTLTYYPNGTVYSVADGLGQQTLLSDWKRGIPKNIRYHDQTVERAEVNDHGWITSVSDAAVPARTTGYGYDLMGRLQSITPQDSTWAATSLTFQAVANPIAGLTGNYWRQRITRGGYQKDTYFDALYRPVLVQESGSGKSRFSVKAFDVMNREVFTSYPLDALSAYPSDTLTVSAQATAGVRNTSFDVLGRLLESKATGDDEAGERTLLTTKIAYRPGFRKEITNPRNKLTTISFQAFGSPSEDFPVKIEAPEGQTTTIQRDVYGKPTSIWRSGMVNSAAVTVARSFVYDTQQRLCKRVEPETGATLYDYDAADNLKWSVNGTTLIGTSSCDRQSLTAQTPGLMTRGYDTRNRLTSINFPNSTATAPFAFTYWPDGQLKTAARNQSTWTYTYNTLGLLATETLDYANQLRQFSYDYDALGNLLRTTYPGNEQINHAPDAFGQSTQVGGYASSIQYYANGSLKQANLGTALTLSRTLNTRQLPKELKYVSGGQEQVRLKYSFDANGNVKKITDLRPNITDDQIFTYDGLDRLSTATAAATYGSAWFQYDVFDNLRRQVVGTRDLNYHYSDNQTIGNQLNSIALANGTSFRSFSYDNRGNVLNDGANTFIFDLADTVTRISGPSGEENYLYDANGHRIQISVDGQITYPVYTKDGLLRAEYGAQTQRYYYLGTQLIARSGIAQRLDLIFSSGFEALVGSAAMNAIKSFLDKAAQSVVTTYYLNDHLGSNIATADTTGAIIERTSYAPFGEVWGEARERGPGYTGHFEDATGMTYMKARYYGGPVGRFMSPDPVGVDKAMGENFNRYWYGNNNPQKFVDPDGRETGAAFRSGYNFGTPPAGVDSGMREFMGGLILGGVAAMTGVGLAVELGAIVSAARVGYAAGAANATVAGTSAVSGGLGGAAMLGADAATPLVGSMLAEVSVGGAAIAARPTAVSSSGPDFIVSPGGTAFPVPKGATGPTPVVNPAGKITGAAFTGGSGGANGQVATARIMNATPPRGNSPGYPNGYIKYENAAGQGVDPYSGKTLSNKYSHFPID